MKPKCHVCIDRISWWRRWRWPKRRQWRWRERTWPMLTMLYEWPTSQSTHLRTSLLVHVKIYIRWMNLSPCLSGFWRASCVASTVRRRKRWRLWGGSLVKPSLVLPLLHSTRYQLWRQTPPAPASSQKLPFYVFPHLSPLKPCLLFFPKVSLVDSSWEM